MAEEDLSKLWEGLKLTDNEEAMVKLEEQDVLAAAQRGINCLLAMVICERNFNKEAFRSTMPQVWKTERGITFTEVGDHTFIIEFKQATDKTRVLQGMAMDL
ncbi:hypothetical protein I3843_09G150700 [Carya illinoinensis]|nr:hypothetical protein I3843_09G150700 [Carya illinoinensis]